MGKTIIKIYKVNKFNKKKKVEKDICRTFLSFLNLGSLVVQTLNKL